MKRFCKDIDITDISYIENCILDFIKNKKRKRICRFFAAATNKERSKVELCFSAKNSEFYKIIKEVAIILSQEIKNHNLILRKVNYYERMCPSTRKMRKIGVQCTKQQIYDYIVVNALKEMIPSLGRYQCACLPNRGQEYGVRRIFKWLQNPEIKYGVKMDIRKCYESIDKETLMTFLHKKIKNPHLLWLIRTLIDTFDYTLSIGSYLSQYLCNIFLSQGYHYLSSDKCPAVKHCLFYMDDILVLGLEKAALRKDILSFIKFMKDNLKLDIKENWTLFRIEDFDSIKHSQIVEMMGYRIGRTKITIRKRIFNRIRKLMNGIEEDLFRRKHVNKKRLIKVPAYKGRILTSTLSPDNFWKVAKRSQNIISKLNKVK